MWRSPPLLKNWVALNGRVAYTARSVPNRGRISIIVTVIVTRPRSALTSGIVSSTLSQRCPAKCMIHICTCKDEVNRQCGEGSGMKQIILYCERLVYQKDLVCTSGQINIHPNFSHQEHHHTMNGVKKQIIKSVRRQKAADKKYSLPTN